ncbi:MAG: protein kinase [Acidobacteriota bacterium]|nr:protein kinase [Acidobacteriota bacterium]
MTLSPGTRLGPYEIVAQIGAGGMGEVYRASDTRLSRQVALKVIAPRWSSDRQIRQRFEREARAISALSHPHVCTLHDIGEQGDVEFLVMEFVEGETLGDRLIRGPLTLDEFSRYGSEIADALQIAHERGITHRDLKPGNIMITPRNSVKILDFGLAKLEEVIDGGDGATELQTRPGVAIGTFQYMSPEQATGETVGPPSDIFSLGILLYEALTGRHPFESGNRAELVRAIVSSESIRASAVRPEVPAPIDELFDAMLMKEPSRRPKASEVHAALQNVAVPNIVATPKQRPARHVVGREDERARIVERFGKARGEVISVTGEAGLGKTTLVEECLAQAGERTRGVIAVGRCSERLAGSEAYLPILEALAALVKSDRTLAQTLKLLAPAWYRQVAPAEPSAPHSTSPPAAGQERLKREMTAFFEEATRSRPIILFLDDIHWADASTIDLIGYLAAHLGEMRLFIITTARQSELLLRKHSFLQLTRELQPRGSLEQFSLHFLSWDDLQKYIQLEFPDHRFGEDFQSLIYQKTEGSPLFMVDLLRYLRDQKVIALRDGVWTLTREVGEIEQEIPASVRSMIDRKIDQLSDEQRRILIAASVQGAEFDSVVVARALEMDAAEVEETLAQLDRIHELISAIGEREHADGTPSLRYRFVHVLYQNNLYASLGPAKKVTLSSKVADALRKVSAASIAPVASQLALLYETARDFGQATHFFLVAAQHARRLFANQEAILLARRGLDCAKRIANPAEREGATAPLHELLGDVFAFIGQHGDGRAAYTKALENSAAEDGLARARLLRKTANILVVERAYPDAAAAFDSAERQVESMDTASGERWREWIEIQLDRGWMFYWQADLASLDRLTEQIEREIKTRATPAQRAKFFHVRVMAGLRRDRYAVSDETLALASMALAAEEAAGERSDMGMFMLGFSHMWRNELDLAEPLLQRALKGSERSGDIVLQSRCLTYLTIVARKRRDDATVLHFAERSMAVASAGGMVEYVAVAKANLAWLAWRKGDLDEVLRLGQEAVELARALPLAGPNWWAVSFPMIDALLQRDRTIDAVQLAEVLIQPQQHRLNDALQAALRESVQSWTEDRSDDARQTLERACELAKESLFL